MIRPNTDRQASAIRGCKRQVARSPEVTRARLGGDAPIPARGFPYYSGTPGNLSPGCLAPEYPSIKVANMLKLTLFSALLVLVGLRAAPARAADPAPSSTVAAPVISDVFTAARNNDVTSVRQFAATGGDLNSPDARGFTPLILAAYNESGEVVDFLLAQKVDVHAGDKTGSNALMAASFKGFTPIVARLLAAGARVDDSHRGGGTALMFAALSGRTEVVKLLLKHGANSIKKDARGLTALDLAAQQGNDPMVILLRTAMKKPDVAAGKRKAHRQ